MYLPLSLTRSQIKIRDLLLSRFVADVGAVVVVVNGGSIDFQDLCKSKLGSWDKNLVLDLQVYKRQVWGVVNLAGITGLLPLDPLFRFVLLIMFALPPGVNISTMAQLFSVGQEECAMLMMWTYFAAAFALTAWSSVYMWILS